MGELSRVEAPHSPTPNTRSSSGQPPVITRRFSTTFRATAAMTNALSLPLTYQHGRFNAHSLGERRPFSHKSPSPLLILPPAASSSAARLPNSPRRRGPTGSCLPTLRSPTPARGRRRSTRDLEPRPFLLKNGGRGGNLLIT